MPTLGQLKKLLAAETRRLRREENRRKRERVEYSNTSHARVRPQGATFSLPGDWFKIVTSEQRRRDNREAIWDSLFVRLHRYADPFKAYESKLNEESILAKARLDSSQFAPDLENKDEIEAKRLRADAAYEAEVIKINEELINTVGADFHKELESSIESEINDLSSSYQMWKNYLGRPSFSERFEDLRSWFDGQKKIEKDPEKKVGRIERFVEWLQYMISKYALPTLVPAEIYFAKPGFEFLTPENRYAALASAIAFSGLLVLSGWAFASFVGRSTINSVSKDINANSIVMNTRPRICAIFLACLFFCIGVAMSLSGAYLRSKIPEISIYFIDRHHLIEDQKDLDVKANSGEIKGEEYRNKNDEQDKKSHELEERFNIIRLESFKFFAADSLVAIFIYFAIFMAAFSKRILSRDPILEYEIIASNLMELKTFKRVIINWRESERRRYLSYVASAKDRLARVQANLGTVAPDDPNALPKVVHQPHASQPEVNAAAPEEAANDPTTEVIIENWKALRLRNYTRIYIMLKGGSILQDHRKNIPTYLKA